VPSHGFNQKSSDLLSNALYSLPFLTNNFHLHIVMGFSTFLFASNKEYNRIPKDPDSAIPLEALP